MAVAPAEMLAAAASYLDGTGEVHSRNAASRAYYAAYHRCRLLAEQEGLSIPEGGSAHWGLVEALAESQNSRPMRQLSSALDRCRIRRKDADYEIDKEFERQLAKTVVEDCREILANADLI